jgi:hypothetical protein
VASVRYGPGPTGFNHALPGISPDQLVRSRLLLVGRSRHHVNVLGADETRSAGRVGVRIPGARGRPENGL